MPVLQAPPAPVVCVEPNWARRPNVDQMQAVWPTAAVRDRREGSARLHCRLTPGGVLADCRVEDEKPAGYGFGGAALLLAPNFLMTPKRCNGVAVAGEVTIPVNFKGAPPAIRGNPQQASVRVLSWVPWARHPSLEDVRTAFPAAAQARHVFGAVVFRCEVRRDGALADCEVTQETTSGVGFAPAARRLLPKFQVRLEPKDAAQVSGYRVIVSVRFSPRSLDPGPVVWAAAPDWLKLADADAVIAAYPAAARAAHVATGRAVLDCGVGPDGALVDCRADSETPRDLGFADAAVKLASAMRANPWSRDGEPLAGERVRLPLRLEDGAAAEAPAPKPAD